MSDDLIERLKAATEGTTPGPWSFGRTGDEQRMILGGSSGNYVANVQIYQTPRHMGQWQEPEREANARFIAAARELVPAMRDRIEADAKRIAELEELLKEARTDLEHYVDNDWPEKERAAYPSCQRKYKRDMELCYRIDAALEGEKK